MVVQLLVDVNVELQSDLCKRDLDRRSVRTKSGAGE